MGLFACQCLALQDPKAVAGEYYRQKDEDALLPQYYIRLIAFVLHKVHNRKLFFAGRSTLLLSLQV